MDRHHVDADPDTDPTFHFYADPDRDPTFHFDVDPDRDPGSVPGPDPTPVLHRLENKKFFTAVPVYTLFSLSRQHYRCHYFQYLGHDIAIFLRKVNIL